MHQEIGELSDENYKVILNNMGDPVFVKDEQSRLVLVNDAFCEVFGRPRNEIIGKTLAEDVLPEERDHFLKVDKQVISTGKESVVEESLTIRDGETRTISTRKTRFIDQNGGKFLVGVIRDVTEIKQAEALVRLNKYNEFLLSSAQILAQSNKNYKALLQELAKRVSLYLDAVCDISILNSELGTIVPEAVYCSDKAVMDVILKLFAQRTVKKGEGLVGSVIDEGKEILIKTVPDSMKVGPANIDSRIVPESIMYVPLKGERKTLGSLNLSRLSGQSAFNDFEIDQIRRLGEYLSLFIENVVLREEQRAVQKLKLETEHRLAREKKWAEFKLKVSRLLAKSDSDFDKILAEFAQLVATQFDAVCDVQLVDKETQIIIPVAVYHKDVLVRDKINELFGKSRFKVGEGMIGHVIATGKELFVSGLNDEMLEKAKAAQVDIEILPSSFFYRPLAGNDSVFGTLNITRIHGQRPLEENEIGQIRDLAEHASRFIENRILQSLQEREILLRSKAEERLEKTLNVLSRIEAETRTILNAIPIYIARVSTDLRYLFLNEAYRQRGLDPRSAEGKKVEEIIGTSELDKLMVHVDKVLEGNLVNYEHERTTEDGVYRYFNVALAPDYSEDGIVIGFYVCSTDMTSKVIAEREAKLTQERFESLSLNSGDAFFFHDAEQNILDVNEVATEMLGYSRDELLKLKAHQLDPKWNGGDYQKVLERLEANVPKTIDTFVLHKDGYQIPVESRFVKRVEGGKIYIQSLLRDRTEKRNQEIKLQRSEERLRLVFDNVEDSITTVDENGIIETINKTFQGLDPNEVIGANIFDFYSNADVIATVKAKFCELVETGKSFELEDPFTGPDGTTHVYSIKYNGIFHLNKFYKAIVIVRDVTAERDRENSIMSGVLKGQEQERKRLGAELHDGIGQVLTAIALQVSQIREQVSQNDVVTITTDLTKLNVNLQEAIREVRNISHDLMPEVLESFGLKEAINQTCNNFRERSDVVMKFHHADLEPRYNHLIEVNLFRITQELLTNIHKHAHCTKVFISLMDHGDSINLTVEDDGVGFDSRQQIKGIGLGNVYSRVNMLGGQIDIESAQNSGTLINIDVPKKLE